MGSRDKIGRNVNFCRNFEAAKLFMDLNFLIFLQEQVLEAFKFSDSQTDYPKLKLPTRVNSTAQKQSTESKIREMPENCFQFPYNYVKSD